MNASLLSPSAHGPQAPPASPMAQVSPAADTPPPTQPQHHQATRNVAPSPTPAYPEAQISNSQQKDPTSKEPGAEDVAQGEVHPHRSPQPH
eukprot:86169-Pleurochrysis_carterae.AAC.1